MYHISDTYDQILEDIGNLRSLTPEQISYLCLLDKKRIIAVIIALSRSRELLMEVVMKSESSKFNSKSQKVLLKINTEGKADNNSLPSITKTDNNSLPTKHLFKSCTLS
jgi:hypothetical protein